MSGAGVGNMLTLYPNVTIQLSDGVYVALPIATGSSAATGIPSLPAAASISSIPLLSPSLHLHGSSSTSVTTSPATTLATAATAAGPYLPSLATLLATPLSLPGPSTPLASPLILSPALPPVPAKVVDKAHKGAFIDFKEFLVDNTLLLQRIQELSQAGAIPAAAQPLLSGSRMREVSDPLTWVSCFLAFMAAKIDHEETRRLAAYGMIIMQLVRKHGGNGWRLYDKQFRLQQAAGAGLSWVEINPSLLAATVLGQPSDRGCRPCLLCLAPDHTREDCALVSLEYQRPSPFLPALRPPSYSPVHPGVQPPTAPLVRAIALTATVVVIVSAAGLSTSAQGAPCRATQNRAARKPEGDLEVAIRRQGPADRCRASPGQDQTNGPDLGNL